MPLRADTGCIQWTYQAVGPIRSTIVAAPSGASHFVVFGDLTGWLYALDAATGREVWKIRPEPHEAVRLSAPPLIRDGRVIVGVASWRKPEPSTSDTVQFVSRQPGGCSTYGRKANLADLHHTEKAGGRGRRPRVDMLGPSGVGVWGTPAVDPRRRRL